MSCPCMHCLISLRPILPDVNRPSEFYEQDLVGTGPVLMRIGSIPVAQVQNPGYCRKKFVLGGATFISSIWMRRGVR